MLPSSGEPTRYKSGVKRGEESPKAPSAALQGRHCHNKALEDPWSSQFYKASGKVQAGWITPRPFPSIFFLLGCHFIFLSVSRP